MAAHLRDDGYWGDLEIFWPQFLMVVPQIDLVEARFYLVFDVFLEEGNGVLGSWSWVGAVVDRGHDDVPVPLWAAVKRNPVPPFLQGWREQVDLGKRLGLH
jgi:hypothetical protein